MRKVTLRKVSLLTSGVYRCEVTSKLSPAGIDSEVREDRMVVLGETTFQHSTSFQASQLEINANS